LNGLAISIAYIAIHSIMIFII